MWWIVHCCDGHRKQEEVSDKPQSLRREGVFSQFTEAFKTNLATLEKGLQIRFFQEKSKGSAFSAHCSQTPCCFKVKEWFSHFCSEKDCALFVIIFLLSSTEGFGLKFPNPSPSWFDWPGKQRLSVTSELITFATLVARQTLEHFWI